MLDRGSLSRRRFAGAQHYRPPLSPVKSSLGSPHSRKRVLAAAVGDKLRRRLRHHLARLPGVRCRGLSAGIGKGEILALCSALALILRGTSVILPCGRRSCTLASKPRETLFPNGAAFFGTRRLLPDRDDRLPILDRSSFGKSYGKLKIRKLPPGEARAVGPPDPRDTEADETLPLDPPLLDPGWYAPFDDDAVRSAVFRTMNKETNNCLRAPWHKFHRPNCNDFHSVDVLAGVTEDNISYLSHGFFRQAFSIKGRTSAGTVIAPNVTLKALRWRSDYDDFIENRMEKTRMDALIMERLTSSPRITDVHGHCAFSVVTESLPGEMWDDVVPTHNVIDEGDLHDKDGVDNKNGMSPIEKLKLALNIAEALSDLHGFKDGVIVHDDLDLGQYLRTRQIGGKVKLNDFNRAKPLLWDPLKQKYCKYYNGHIGGKLRSPEEYTEPPGLLNEKMDVFALGNIFYGILTGLFPFYFSSHDEAEKRLVKGDRAYIDERWRTHSFAEKKLIDAIEKCWIHDPDERTDIFWVVRFLRDALDEHRDQQKG